MKKTRTILLLCLTYFILGCTTTKNTADIEDVWKPVENVNEIIGEWETVILLENGSELPITFTYKEDKNKNIILNMIVDLEPMFDKMSKDKIEKDKIWEVFIIDVKENEDNGINIIFEKYYAEFSVLYLSHEDRNKKINDGEIYINQFGNKMKGKQNVSSLLPEDFISKKVKKPKRIRER